LTRIVDGSTRDAPPKREEALRRYYGLSARI
jgi:hypothetical protein